MTSAQDDSSVMSGCLPESVLWATEPQGLDQSINEDKKKSDQNSDPIKFKSVNEYLKRLKKIKNFFLFIINSKQKRKGQEIINSK